MISKILSLITVQNISLVIFFVGLYGLAARRNIVKTILSFGIIQAAAILFFASVDATQDTPAPIGSFQYSLPADPIPISIMITVIVVGVSVTALTLNMFTVMYHKYASTNWVKVMKIRKGK